LIPIDLVCLKEYGFAGDLQVGEPLGMCAIFKGELNVSPGDVLAIPVPQADPVVA
jgi:hypothetical protein